MWEEEGLPFPLSLMLTPFAVQVGLTCLISQCLLYLIFSYKYLGDGPWTQMPSFTAHQIIVVPVLMYLVVEGLREWVWATTVESGSSENAADAAIDRMVGPRHGHMLEFVMGMMLLWDLPTGLLTPALCELPMVLHHLGMLATAAIGMGILSDGKPVLGYYAPFFFGLIELSSFPLILVDVFHPKHGPWYAYLHSDSAPTWLAPLNDLARLQFAVLFLLTRTLYFPYVMLAGVLPDVYAVTSTPLEERNGVPNLPFYVMATLNVLFTILQLYWGFLVMRQVVKKLMGKKDASGKEKTS